MNLKLFGLGIDCTLCTSLSEICLIDEQTLHVLDSMVDVFIIQKVSC